MHRMAGAEAEPASELLVARIRALIISTAPMAGVHLHGGEA